MLQKAYNFFIIYKKGKINSKIIFYYILYFIIFRLHLNLRISKFFQVSALFNVKTYFLFFLHFYLNILSGFSMYFVR